MSVKMDKLCLIVAVVFATAAFAKAAGEEVQPKTLWMDQKLDHFNESETRTWRMRYLMNDEFAESGGPFFIYVGGYWGISSDGIGRYRHIYSMAKEHHGTLFHTEHRYYGESRPVSDMSNENLQYLSVEQSLADLAHFIRTMKANIPGMSKSKVILVGCSYAGTLVTWFKVKYPELATGGWASSAPLLAKTDFFEFNELMGKSINNVSYVTGDFCYKRIENGFSELESMFENNRGAEVKTKLKLCSSFDENNKMDISTLFYEISKIFANSLQSNSGKELKSDCARIRTWGSTAVDGLIKLILHKLKPGNDCVNISYRGYLEMHKNTSFSQNFMRASVYQACNELGFFRTSSSSKQPFGSTYPLAFFTTLCADLYGEKFTAEYIEERIQETNKIFGGLNPDVENVYWTHGELDPWRSVGIQNAMLSTIIPKRSHCSDLAMIAPGFDTPELIASKEIISSLVGEWLV